MDRERFRVKAAATRALGSLGTMIDVDGMGDDDDDDEATVGA